MLAEKTWHYMFSVSVTCCHSAGNNQPQNLSGCTPLSINCTDGISWRKVRQRCWSCLFLFTVGSQLAPCVSTPRSLAPNFPRSKGQGTRIKVERVQVHFSNFSCITTANILLAKRCSHDWAQNQGTRKYIPLLDERSCRVTLQMTWIGGMKNWDH